MAIDPFQSTYNPTMVAGGQQPYGYSAYNPNLQGAYSATLSPQEVAQLSAGDRLGLEIGRKKKQVQDIAKKIPGQTQQAYADILPGLAAAGVNTRNIGRLGSAGVTGLSAYQQFAANEPTGAIASIAGGLGAGKLASMGARVLTAGMPGIGGKIIRAAAPILGSVLGTQLGPAAEGIKNAVTGQQTGNKPETKGTETPLFGPNNIPLNEAARRYAYETQLMDREFGYSKQDLIQHQFQQQLLSKSLDQFEYIRQFGTPTTAEQLEGLIPLYEKLDKSRAETANKMAERKFGQELFAAGIGALGRGITTSVAGGSPAILGARAQAHLTGADMFQRGLQTQFTPAQPMNPRQYQSPRYFS
jgi:hypothetical protein